MQNPTQKQKTAAPRDPFDIRETKLCAELGMSKDELRRRRQYFLRQHHHWDYVDKRVLLNRDGAEVLRVTRDLKIPHESEKGAPTADSGSARPIKALLPERTWTPRKFEGRLVAWAMPSRNTRIVVGHVPGADPGNPLNLVTILVRDNKNFLRGMEIPGPGREVRQTGEFSFELLGAPPRYRGRW
jgi:hypothetical protein